MSTVEPATSPELPEAEKQVTATLLDALDTHVGAPDGSHADHRGQARHRFRTECIVRYFGADRTAIEQTAGRTRNISRSGIAVLVKRWFRVGDPVYLILSLTDGPASHLAGKVVFARRAHGPWFELGVQLQPGARRHALAPGEDEVASADAQATGNAPGSESSRTKKLNTLSVARATAGYSKEARRAILGMATSSDEMVRARALEALIDVGGKAAAGTVIQALADADEDVRLAAIAAVNILDITTALPALKTRLSNDSAPVQLRAAATLGRFGDQAGLPVAMHWLEHQGENARLAALAYGEILGQEFRPNAEGVAAARRYMEARKRVTQPSAP